MTPSITLFTLVTHHRPPAFKSNITDIFLDNVPLSNGATYYLKVITEDTQGNTSESAMVQFKVE